MINVDGTKYDPTKSAVSSKFKRLPPPRASTPADAGSEFDAGKEGADLVPYSAAGDGAAPSPNDIDVPHADGNAERAGDFSPGKDPDLGSLVVYYIGQIGQSWRRVVQAMIEVARLCAEANARLTAAQKSALIQALPFGNTAFSKFVQIGSDTRLYAPEIQLLLPPHYTTMYAVTLLTDEELSRAIAENVLHPDMPRAQLQKWRNSHREKLVVAPSPNEAASDPDAVGAPTTSTQGAAVSGALPSAIGNDKDVREQLAVAPKDASASEAVATAAEIAGPLTPPPNDDEIPPFLDRRPFRPTINARST